MKKKIVIGGLSALLIFGGAAAVGASKSGTQPDDSIHSDDKNTSNTVDLKTYLPFSQDKRLS